LKNKYDITLDHIYTLLSSEDEPLVSQKVVKNTENALILYAKTHALNPHLTTKMQILAKLQQLELQRKSFNPPTKTDFPDLTASPNIFQWHNYIKELTPPEKFENIYYQFLESNKKRDLIAVWVNEDIPEEVHDDCLESFLLLEGSCECEIWDAKGNNCTLRIFPGDVITFKLGEYHNLVNLSSTPLVGIVQRMKLAV
jgi:mannose-6-phosphate isomerase-like protein (cupin superfamily)